MEFTRRDTLKTLAALPFVGMATNKKKQSEVYKPLFRLIDLDENPKSFPTYKTRGWDGLTCKLTIPMSLESVLEGEPAPDRWYCSNYGSDVGMSKYKSLETGFETIEVPLSRDVAGDEQSCMELVLAALYDANIVVYDADANGYSDRLEKLMSRLYYDMKSRSPYSRYISFPMDKIIHCDKRAVERFIDMGFIFPAEKKTGLCIGINNDAALYMIKKGPYTGLVCLDNKQMVLGAY